MLCKLSYTIFAISMELSVIVGAGCISSKKPQSHITISFQLKYVVFICNLFETTSIWDWAEWWRYTTQHKVCNAENAILFEKEQNHSTNYSHSSSWIILRVSDLCMLWWWRILTDRISVKGIMLKCTNNLKIFQFSNLIHAGEEWVIWNTVGEYNCTQIGKYSVEHTEIMLWKLYFNIKYWN